MPFTKGHTLSKGRPKLSKNVMPIIREKILHKLHSRINELDKVDVTELLGFMKAIMPKDISISVNPNIQYISNTPRPIETIEVLEDTKNTKDITNTNSNVLSNVSNDNISNDIVNDTVTNSNVSNDINTVTDNNIENQA